MSSNQRAQPVPSDHQAQPLAIPRRGLMLVLSSPSGAGKTTLTRMLLEIDPSIAMSVSVTTRKPRPGEIDGVHYHFVDHDRFAEMRDAGALLEWARVFDNFYGTPRAPMDVALSAGRDVVFDIDWQGTQQLRQEKRSDLVSVFILPPSEQELERRLRARAQDPEDVIAKRMSRASEEMSHWAEYDYVIVNTNVYDSLASVRHILNAERLRRERQVGLANFVRSLEGDI
ncbi:MAG: guanylate kinase [Beijerinckiaceae bacterium]|nr:guanylate kinase [Beijerinckiaceae bacterium]